METKNKKTAVYRDLKAQIISGKLAPGTPIHEKELARNLNVSKTPVRESLQQLESEGLIEKVPGRGSHVAHITLDYVREIYEIREIIECGAAKRAALLQRQDEIRLKKEEIEKAARQAVAGQASDLKTLEDIHFFVIEMLNNKRLAQSYREVAQHNRRIVNHLGRHSPRWRVEQVFGEHLEILQAMVEGNPEKAEAAVQQHLRKAATYLMGLLIPAQ